MIDVDKKSEQKHSNFKWNEHITYNKLHSHYYIMSPSIQKSTLIKNTFFSRLIPLFPIFKKEFLTLHSFRIKILLA